MAATQTHCHVLAVKRSYHMSTSTDPDV